MRTATIDELTQRLRTLPENPRVVVSGNMAVPWEAVRALDEAQPTYLLHALNAPAGLPTREGVTVETCFVGPGMRRHPQLRYVPSRLSLVPLLFGRALPPDAVLLHCAPPRRRPGEHGPRGQRAAGGARGVPRARRSRRGGGQPADALHVRRRRGAPRAHRPHGRGRLPHGVARRRAPRPREPGHRRARRSHGQGRRDDAARHRRRARRDSRRADVATRPADVDRDVLRRRPGPRRGRRARPGPPARHLVHASARPTSTPGSTATRASG